MAPQNPTEQFLTTLEQATIEEIRNQFKDLFSQALTIATSAEQETSQQEIANGTTDQHS